MKRKTSLIFILCAFLFLAFPLSISGKVANSSGDAGFAVAASTVDPWPLFHHDLAHTGGSNSKAPNSNATLWNYTTSGDVNDPAVVNGVVFIGSYDDKVYALNAKNGSLIWSYTTGGYVDTSPAVSDGIVFVNSNDNKTFALNATNGALIWSYTTKRHIDSAPAVAGGVVFTGSGDRNVYALNAKNGNLIWNYTTGGVVFLSSPAVDDNMVFIGASRRVYDLNATNGALIWNYTARGRIQSSPAVANGEVFVGSTDHNLYALNESTGTLLWNYTTGGYVDSGPAVVNKMVFVGSADHNIYALNAKNGNLIWNYTTGGIVASSPAVADGVVFVGSLDNKIYALNAANGALIWSYTTGGFVVSSPAVVDGIVYLGSWDHRVYAFGSLPNVRLSSNSDLIVPVLVVVSIVLSATCAYILRVFFVCRRKVKRQLVNSSVNENPSKPKLKGIPITKVEVVGNALKFFVAKGFRKKHWVAVKETPVYKITRIENFGNEISITWKGVANRFLLKKNVKSLGKFRNKVQRMLEKQQKPVGNKGKAALRRKELLVMINASIGIIDSSFDVLIELMKEKRINWQQLEGYSNGLGENLRFIGETMPSLSLDFSRVSSAIKRQVPKETSNEANNILKTVYDYFKVLSFDDDIKKSVPNFQNGTDIILGYFTLNDLLLNKVVGDKDSKEEINQLETVLQILAKATNFKVNFEELKGSINAWGREGNRESVIEESRGIFRRQLKQL